MTWLLVIDLVVCALSIGVRIPAIRHYLRNWRGRVRRNPESAALALEIVMNCYGATMGALGAIATHEVRVPVVMTMISPMAWPQTAAASMMSAAAVVRRRPLPATHGKAKKRTHLLLLQLC